MTAFRAIRRAAGIAALAVCSLGAATADAELVFKDAKGTTIPFAGSPHIWCGAWEKDVPTPALHLRLVTAGHHGGWSLDAVRRDVIKGRRIAFPLDFVFDHPRGASFFVAYRGNETSTAQEDSKGSLRFSRVSCRPGGIVAFTVHATLGSELGEPPISVSGTFRGHVSATVHR